MHAASVSELCVHFDSKHFFLKLHQILSTHRDSITVLCFVCFCGHARSFCGHVQLLAREPRGRESCCGAHSLLQCWSSLFFVP